ncbi:MAG: DUF2892 domain-containing protein [Actinomycetia bacterium]|nr:DUF2892 domain-containing protein [Actinomycetes bacterium]
MAVDRKRQRNPGGARRTRRRAGRPLHDLGRNRGSLERTLRIVGGLGLLWLLIAGLVPGWGLEGLILVVTGITGSCWTYRSFNIGTVRARQGSHADTH